MPIRLAKDELLPTPTGYSIPGHGIILIDDDDLPLVRMFGWYRIRMFTDRAVIAATTIRSSGEKMFQQIPMQHLILKLDPKEYIRFKNGNRFDYRKCNLQHVKTKAKSGYYGVYYVEKRRYYAAVIKYQGKLRQLGTFKRAKDAARAVDKEVRRLYGRKARQNFPND